MEGVGVTAKSASGKNVVPHAFTAEQSSGGSAWKYFKEDVFAPISADYKACLASERYYDPKSTRSPFKTLQTCLSRTAEKMGVMPLWSCFPLPKEELSFESILRLHDCFQAIIKSGKGTKPLTNPKDIIRLGAK